MADTIPLKSVMEAVTALLDETFEHHHGIFLDKGTSLFDTIDGLTAAQASRAASSRSATIAAHVDHLRFYMDVLEAYMLGQPDGKVDWRQIWETTHTVTPEQWDAIRSRLRESYRRVRAKVEDPKAWANDSQLGAIAIVVHTSYHLGAIRQALLATR